ncbi:hypothetical protein A3B21_02900 [Candidatus Uhrbacteria bacterium RIFCSPLOWO2_01_FULL_47_24]|uniref:Uncharacterized protein n=1 Tax=Candidatus Uhrbacteria bacterium RIFCSPLOWO2_01_FULL_47_24 TaxID=1802401 RepID=A0A1F7USD6_9BACT|nr:MAG: hypothetical protein A3D58_01930 [Candidatus Uhrbacteria bacterium RIFCSPHIGHO2_02_FULL_46_47]OGL81213.1 MAG: hypothetical protein A3B21_02900 [Candidatus Uhrbacteria bacterium RIFCSPLOWO2_01_FULL_47_24]OGL84623.1 MAG: hypothetical protein A3J03_02355 [Candidatus Uhrbacteria bacterium RIFCSPLOWO2_02_FULL_46_25]OGL93221.1 MAG: hypothetical protein A3H11_01405 [Candidatus Uhrbacteria bacterium RIFCSPLOWO2_12_FULL_47_10]
MQSRPRRTLYQDRTWLKVRLKRGLTAPQIANQVKVSTPTITRWIAIHDLVGCSLRAICRNYLNRRARATYANRAWLRAELAAEHTYKEIAKKVGVYPLTIANWALRFKLANGHLSHTATCTYANQKWLAAQIARGFLDRQIAHETGVTAHTIEYWRKQFGIRCPPRQRPPRNLKERRAFGTWLAPRLHRLALPETQGAALCAYYAVNGTFCEQKQLAQEQGVTPHGIDYRRTKALAVILDTFGMGQLARFPEIVKRRKTLQAFVPKKQTHTLRTYRDKAWLRARVARNLSDKQIASEVGNTSFTTIAHWRRSFGITRR